MIDTAILFVGIVALIALAWRAVAILKAIQVSTKGEPTMPFDPSFQALADQISALAAKIPPLPAEIAALKAENAALSAQAQQAAIDKNDTLTALSNLLAQATKPLDPPAAPAPIDSATQASDGTATA